MEEYYICILLKNKVYFSDSGIFGESESFSSSIFSITDCISCKSPLDKITSDILEIINKAAIKAVDLVKRFPTDREDAKLSCDKPRPKAPPSDLCNKINKISIKAKTIFTAIRIVSIRLIYRSFLLYQ